MYAIAICLRLLASFILLALEIALPTDGSKIVARIPIIAITVRISMSVNARTCLAFQVLFHTTEQFYHFADFFKAKYGRTATQDTHTAANPSDRAMEILNTEQ
jgi:hypothetical protein